MRLTSKYSINSSSHRKNSSIEESLEVRVQYKTVYEFQSLAFITNKINNQLFRKL
jgi:hypothetical protein